MVAAYIPSHPALVENLAWHGSEVPPDPLPAVGCPLIPPRRSVDLKLRVHAVYAWLWRYVELYGVAPTASDVAVGVELAKLAASAVLHELQERGCVVQVGDGWIPVRAP